MQDQSLLHKLRSRLAHQLDPVLYSGNGMSPLNIAIAVVILAGILLAIIQTEPSLRQGNEQWFRATELALGSLFLLEYLARLWTCVENDSVKSRWQHFFSFFALADLLAIFVALFTLSRQWRRDFTSGVINTRRSFSSIGPVLHCAGMYS